MRGEDLYNLFDAHLGILREQGLYKNMKYEDLTPREKQWYDKVASLVDPNGAFYPTPWAYEQACKSLAHYKDRIHVLEEERKAVIHCINLYGDTVLHKALNMAGLLMKLTASIETGDDKHEDV